MDRMNVVFTVSGACSGNPGPGGYAAILSCGKYSKEISGFESQTTNNRMELRAVIEAIRVLKKPCNIVVRTKSQATCNSIANLENRFQNGWVTKTGAYCRNVDLLKLMHTLKHKGEHELRFETAEETEASSKLAREQISLHTR